MRNYSHTNKSTKKAKQHNTETPKTVTRKPKQKDSKKTARKTHSSTEARLVTAAESTSARGAEQEERGKMSTSVSRGNEERVREPSRQVNRQVNKVNKSTGEGKVHRRLQVAMLEQTDSKAGGQVSRQVSKQAGQVRNR